MIPTTVTLVKREGKLVNADLYNKVKMDTFLDSLKEGERVEVTYEVKHSGGSYSQLSKLHASIRALADETGASFEEMKLTVKRRCGLVVGDNIKSFADCSKDELSKAIQECVSLGDLMNVNLH